MAGTSPAMTVLWVERRAMKRRTFLAGAAASLAPPALAQTQWPLGQPIRIIVPFPAAGVPKHVALLKKASFEAQ
jgi:hypothetical protein